MTIGEKIKTKRNEKGLSQNALGELCGIHGETIRQYELGIRNPKLSALANIAVHLDVPLLHLLDDKEAYGLFGKIFGFEFSDLKKYAESVDLSVPEFIAEMLAQGVELVMAKVQGREPNIRVEELAKTISIQDKAKAKKKDGEDNAEA